VSQCWYGDALSRTVCSDHRRCICLGSDVHVQLLTRLGLIRGMAWSPALW